MTLIQFGHQQGQADHTLFVKSSKNGRKSILIVTGDDIQGIETLKRQLKAEFEVKDLGLMKYFLGMEVARSQEGLFISQRKYTMDLLKDTGMMDCRPTGTPLDKGWKSREEDDNVPMDKERYQRLVGRLIYLSLGLT